MTSHDLTNMHQSKLPALRPGNWRLEAGRALTLRPMTAGVVRIADGRAWATFDGPHRGPLNDFGDRVVAAGGQLRVRAGQRVVIEAWRDEPPVAFSWDPLPLPLPARSAAERGSDVLEPLADLRLALVFGTAAVGRLMAGLARLAWDRVAGRGGAARRVCHSVVDDTG